MTVKLLLISMVKWLKSLPIILISKHITTPKSKNHNIQVQKNNLHMFPKIKSKVKLNLNLNSKD
jgi:hypothetical protein